MGSPCSPSHLTGVLGEEDPPQGGTLDLFQYPRGQTMLALLCLLVATACAQNQQQGFIDSLKNQGFTDDQIRGFFDQQSQQRQQQPAAPVPQQQQQQQPRQQQQQQPRQQQQSQRTKVQFRVAVDNEDFGVINMELFDEVVPRTAANFAAIASGQNQQGFSYKNTIFHRIIPQFMLQGGDFERFDGTGGQSIYGPSFEDENFLIKHASPGLLSMANSGPNTNGAQFFITTVKTPWLDDKHVVFGRVDDQESFNVVKRIEALGSSGGTPSKQVVITDSRVTQAGAAARQG